MNRQDECQQWQTETADELDHSLRRLENRIRLSNQRICDIDALLAMPIITFNPFLMKYRKRRHAEREHGLALIREWNRKADAASESVSVRCKYNL